MICRVYMTGKKWRVSEFPSQIIGNNYKLFEKFRELLKLYRLCQHIATIPELMFFLFCMNKAGKEFHRIAIMANKMHWSMALLSSMNDPDAIDRQDEQIVVIRDKYPKARYHFLVLPKKDIPSINHVTRDDRELIEHMEAVAKEIASEYSDYEFKIGYHAVPSMQRLHLHVISTDFVSACLKTKQHWNSFTTGYFIPSEDIRKQLQDTGTIKKMSNAEGDRYLKESLKCHKCDFQPKFLPELKRHILEHVSQS